MSNTIDDYYERTSDATKRDLTSPDSGETPTAKRQQIDYPDWDTDPIDDDSPSWAKALFQMMRKTNQRMDSLSQKFDTIRHGFEEKVDQFINQTKKEVADLSDGVIYISNKFDEQQSDLKALTDRITKLETDLSKAHDDNMNKIDALEQYGRRNCLLIHGITETDNENTNVTAVDTIINKLGVQLSEYDLDRSHRIGK